jgi:hypothetical protein
MKKNVTFGEISKLVDARLYLLMCQRWLWIYRVSGQMRPIVAAHEKSVSNALDRLWEAQQRAA